jgi:tyrosine-protein phosphatase YwqE
MDIMMGMGTMKKKIYSQHIVDDDTPMLNIDLHSHLIPNLDDGAKDMDESLKLLKALEEAGYYKLITTPHIMMDSYRNTRHTIMQGLAELQIMAKQAGLRLEIEAAAEYYLDDGFISHIEQGKLLTLANKYVLFETSYMAKPLDFESMIAKLLSTGYIPLLAHPERYRYIEDLVLEYTALKKLGIFFQVNINSFGGHYGKDAQDKALFLSQNGMIDFLGSDVHHLKQVKTLVAIKKTQVYKDIFKKNLILNNLL